jgi:hypothetical protein
VTPGQLTGFVGAAIMIQRRQSRQERTMQAETGTQSKILAATLAVLICGGLAFLINITLRTALTFGPSAPVGEALSLVPVLFVHPAYEALEKRRLHPLRLRSGGLGHHLRKSIHPVHGQPWGLTALAWAAALTIVSQLIGFAAGFLGGFYQLTSLLVAASIILVVLMAGIGLGFALRRVPYGIRTLAVMAYGANLIGNLISWSILSPADWQAALTVQKTVANAVVLMLLGGTGWLVVGLIGFGLGSLIRRKPVAAPAPVEDNSRLVLISPDGRFVFNGIEWQPLVQPLTPDRRWVWDGHRWVPARILPPPPTAS